MPEVEVAVCAIGRQLVSEALSIDVAREWGRPAITPMDFYCIECGTKMSAVIGSAEKVLRHSPFYRAHHDKHRSWCPHFDIGDIRRIPENPRGEQTTLSEIPAVFDTTIHSGGGEARVPLFDRDDLPDLDLERIIRLKTRSLERLARHYQALRAAGSDSPLTIKGGSGESYMSVVQRMSNLDVNALAEQRLHVYVGVVGSVKTSNNQHRIFFQTKGKVPRDQQGRAMKSALPPLKASVLIPRTLGPPRQRASVIRTLNEDGKKILYVVGSFRPGGSPGAFTLVPRTAQHLYAAIMD